MTVRKPENTFRAGVHKHLPKGLHHEKMNNPYRSGTADDWYSGNKNDLWVEYKWLPKAPTRPLDLTKGKKPPLSVLQQEWLRERYEEGRNVAVIVGSPAGAVILRDKAWERPITATFALSRQEVAQWIQEQTKSDTIFNCGG